MKNLVVMIVLIVYTSVYAGESSWKSFNDGMAEAKRSNKKILVDVYTDWCGWCKTMDKKTYADATIADYLSKRYVLVKLNAESDKKLSYRNKQMTEREFSSAFGISGYPSTLFLKSDGEPITVYPGYADAAKFIDVLSFIAEDHYLTKKFDEYISRKN